MLFWSAATAPARPGAAPRRSRGRACGSRAWPSRCGCGCGSSRSSTTSSAAMSSIVRPSARRPSTSRSRTVSSALARRRPGRGEPLAHQRGRWNVPPAATPGPPRGSSSASLSSASARARRWPARPRACRRPPSPCRAGRRGGVAAQQAAGEVHAAAVGELTSMSATSGSASTIAVCPSSTVRPADDEEPLPLEHEAEAFAHRRVVLHDDDPVAGHVVAVEQERVLAQHRVDLPGLVVRGSGP